MPLSPFGPVIERESSMKYPKFLHEAPFELMKTGQMSRLPWMLGIANAEGICPVGTFIANEAELKKFDEDFDDLAPLVLDYDHTVNESDRLEVTRKIRKEYFGDSNITIQSANDIVKVGYKLIFNLIKFFYCVFLDFFALAVTQNKYQKLNSFLNLESGTPIRKITSLSLYC
jgi:uncharacterized protein YihD (DUF1040 family)